MAGSCPYPMYYVEDTSPCPPHFPSPCIMWQAHSMSPYSSLPHASGDRQISLPIYSLPHASCGRHTPCPLPFPSPCLRWKANIPVPFPSLPHASCGRHTPCPLTLPFPMHQVAGKYPSPYIPFPMNHVANTLHVHLPFPSSCIR